jgi:hypothetical protein
MRRVRQKADIDGIPLHQHVFSLAARMLTDQRARVHRAPRPRHLLSLGCRSSTYVAKGIAGASLLGPRGGAVGGA